MQWTDEADTTLLELRRSGVSWTQAAIQMGRTIDSLRNRYKTLLTRSAATAAAIPQEERRAFAKSAAETRANEAEKRIAELEQQLANAATGINLGSRLPIETAAEQPRTTADLWADAEKHAEKSIAYYHDRIRFSIDFNKIDAGLPVGVSFASDQHISPGNLIDFKRMREDAELIAATPGLYACLGGDGVDNHIKIPQAVLAARSQPHEQWELYNHYLGIFAPKIMAMISGNHDAWTDQRAGIDMVYKLAQQQRICYAPFEARINATAGNVQYKLAFRHRYRFNSSLNLTHAVKQWWNFGEEEFDIGVICHDHEAEVGTFTRHGLERWAARPGAYQIGSSFVREYGWNQTRPTCPTFVLYPDTRRIVGFNDVRVAAKFLASERGNA